MKGQLNAKGLTGSRDSVILDTSVSVSALESEARVESLNQVELENEVRLPQAGEHEVTDRG